MIGFCCELKYPFGPVQEYDKPLCPPFANNFNVSKIFTGPFDVIMGAWGESVNEIEIALLFE